MTLHLVKSSFNRVDVARAQAALDPDAIAADVARLVREPSVTGNERGAVETLVQVAASRGLDGRVVEHDLAALRTHPDHPGEEAPRSSLCGAHVELPGDGAARLCLNGHLD